MPIINLVYEAPREWKPWANTIAYYPLTADYNDHSWNGYNITTVWASQIWTYQWVKCLDINNSKLIVSSIDAMTTYSEYTWLFYAYWTSNWYEIQFSAAGSWGWNWPSFRSWNSNEIRWWNPSNTYTTFSSTYCPHNTWFLFALVVRSGSWIIYCNNNSSTIKTWVSSPSNNAGTLNIWAVNNQGCYGYLSNLIIEKKARTAQEISDYYNNTKSNYWL